MTLFTHPLIEDLEAQFRKAANARIAVEQAAYMRDQFAFLGIKTPQRLDILRNVIKKYPLSDVEVLEKILRTLWGKSYREFHYAACILAEKHQKQIEPASLKTLEHMLRHHQWWDTIDAISPRLIGPLAQRHPELLAVMDQWIEDEDFWIRRAALLFQLKYKLVTDTDRLFAYCEKTMHEKEFFIRKAIGWCLREYSKTNPTRVRRFLETHREGLSPLSLREAGKYC